MLPIACRDRMASDAAVVYLCGGVEASGPSPASPPRTPQRPRGRLCNSATCGGCGARGGPPGLGSRATQRSRRLRQRRGFTRHVGGERSAIQAEPGRRRPDLYSEGKGAALGTTSTYCDGQGGNAFVVHSPRPRSLTAAKRVVEHGGVERRRRQRRREPERP